MPEADRRQAAKRRRKKRSSFDDSEMPSRYIWKIGGGEQRSL
ncbi:hypothetical protein SC1_01460 [Sphingopyxis sp. C-1]|nr:hypothetical protein SC1_01460 [Sphingopyxis sp. C-1]